MLPGTGFQQLQLAAMAIEAHGVYAVQLCTFGISSGGVASLSLTVVRTASEG